MPVCSSGLMPQGEPATPFVTARTARYLAVRAGGNQTEPGMSGNPKLSDVDRWCPASSEKDADEWNTGDEPMTEAAVACLETSCEEAGRTFGPDPSTAEASKWIGALRARSGRGR
jgi:hypothetical protein